MNLLSKLSPFQKIIAMFFLALTTGIIVQSCSKTRDDFAILEEKTTVLPTTEKTVKLNLDDPALTTLIKKANVQRDKFFAPVTTATTSENSIGDNSVTKILTEKFGAPSWADNQMATYSNGNEQIYVPLIKNGKVAALLTAIKYPKGYKVVVFKINKKSSANDKFSGNIEYFDAFGKSITTLAIESGVVIPTVSTVKKSVGIKTSSEEADSDCGFECLSNCINRLVNQNGGYTFICGLACGNFETVVGAIICGVCVGVTLGVCANECQCHIFLS